MAGFGNTSVSFIPHTYSSFEEFSFSLFTSKWRLSPFVMNMKSCKGMRLELQQSKLLERGLVCLEQVSPWHYQELNECNRHLETSKKWLQDTLFYPAFDFQARSFCTFCTAPINSGPNLFHIMNSAEVEFLAPIKNLFQYKLIVIMCRIVWPSFVHFCWAIFEFLNTWKGWLLNQLQY